MFDAEQFRGINIPFELVPQITKSAIWGGIAFEIK